MYVCVYVYVCMYVGFKPLFYAVRHLDSTASYLPTGLHLRFFRSWPSLHLPSSLSSVFLVLSFVSVSTSTLFWVTFLLPSAEHGRTSQFPVNLPNYRPAAAASSCTHYSHTVSQNISINTHISINPLLSGTVRRHKRSQQPANIQFR